MALVLPEHMVMEMERHAREEMPYEACGIIAGKDALPTRVIRMRNNDFLPEIRFTFDAGQQVDIWRDMESRGEDLFAVYHSHVKTDARMSKLDIDIAGTENMAGNKVPWLVISVADPVQTEVRAWLRREQSLSPEVRELSIHVQEELEQMTRGEFREGALNETTRLLPNLRS